MFIRSAYLNQTSVSLPRPSRTQSPLVISSHPLRRDGQFLGVSTERALPAKLTSPSRPASLYIYKRELHIDAETRPTTLGVDHEVGDSLARCCIGKCRSRVLRRGLGSMRCEYLLCLCRFQHLTLGTRYRALASLARHPVMQDLAVSC